MKVKQIGIDILTEDETDGTILARKIESLLESNGYTVLGCEFQEDMTEEYKRNCPDLLEEE